MALFCECSRGHEKEDTGSGTREEGHGKRDTRLNLINSRNIINLRPSFLLFVTCTNVSVPLAQPLMCVGIVCVMKQREIL